MGIPLNQVNVAEVSVKGLIDSGGSSTVNTNFIFHFRRTSVAVDPDKTSLKNAFVVAGGIWAKVILALNENWSSKIVDIRWVNDALDQYVTFAAVSTGAVVGDRLASDQAAYLLFRTGIRGRSYRGSKHLGPMSETDVTNPDDDIWNAGALTRLAAINTALAAGMTDSTGNVWKHTLLSRKLSQLKTNPTTVVANDIVGWLVNKRTGSMLRRKVKSVY